MPPTAQPHESVLRGEISRVSTLQPGDSAVDATTGAGGHSLEFLSRLGPGGALLCLDVDPQALTLAQQVLEGPAREFQVSLRLRQANFATLAEVLQSEPLPSPPKLILADLGVSSMQLDSAERGFSFRRDAPLDLRMDPTQGRTAAELLQDLGEGELADLLFHLGGERGSRRIARRIVAAREAGRPIRTTGELERLVRSALGIRRHQRIHPATRTFQALRMAVNRELEALEALLAAAPPLLAPGGALLVISFHSGEDRIVKQRFKAWSQTGRFRLMQKGVLRPNSEECQRNPRSRSAKLRGLLCGL